MDKQLRGKRMVISCFFLLIVSSHSLAAGQSAPKRASQGSADAEDLWAARDRAELVRPAPLAFKPLPGAPHVRLSLIPKATTLKPGEAFWYRIELQNLASKPLHWIEVEPYSFFKKGWLRDVYFQFFVEGPDGKREKMLPDRPPIRTSRGELQLPRTMTKEERKDFLAKLNDPRASQLDLKLQPGETLVTRPWVPPSSELVRERISRGLDPEVAASATGGFRVLPTRYRFEKPGRYKITVVLEPPKMELVGVRPETKRIIAESAIGRVESSAIELEVVE